MPGWIVGIIIPHVWWLVVSLKVTYLLSIYGVFGGVLVFLAEVADLAAIIHMYVLAPPGK